VKDMGVHMHAHPIFLPPSPKKKVWIGIHIYAKHGIGSYQIRIHIARVWMLGFEQQERRETKLGFGCSVSHRRNGRQGVCVPGGCSPPTKVTKMEATTPGVGWRWRRPPSRRQQRGNRAHASGTGGREPKEKESNE